MARPEILSMVAERKRQQPISLITRSKAHNLYVNQVLSAKEVADACGLEVTQVYTLATRYGWSKSRREFTTKLQSDTREKVTQLSDEISTAIASECEEIALAGLARAKESTKALHKDAAKDFQAWTAGIRNLATARNLARGIGKADTVGEGERGSVNMFFVSAGGIRKELVAETTDDVL